MIRLINTCLVIKMKRSHNQIDCQVSVSHNDAVQIVPIKYKITIEVGHVPVPHEKPDLGPQYVFRLCGGPTGFESFYINRSNLDMLFKVGWVACAGTNRLFRCFITGDELKRHLAVFLEV